ncbi:MAG: hypothetical protein JWN04_5144 [Myxococcaceae bacterium]|nr:hypothetical protein [Myxococcaceae bacterium]
MNSTTIQPGHSASVSAELPLGAISSAQRWVGRGLSAFAVLFLSFDGVFKLFEPAPVLKAFAELGYPARLAVPLGLLLLACVALYVLPRTAALGALLLTGYLGGAISAHVRIGDPLFSHTLFPLYVAALVWGGLYLRSERVRSAVKLLSQPSV